MTERRYLQLDVFGDRPGAGNPLGVVIDSDGLDADAMQAIAAWTNLSETIFLLPPGDGADYRVRIFTPCRELPFAGHPSVGAAWAVLDQRLAFVRDDALVQDCAAGQLPVRVETRGDAVVPHVRAPRGRRVAAHQASLRLLAEAVEAFPMAPRISAELWNNGPDWWLVELVDGDAVRALVPDLPAIAALSQASGAVGLAVFGRSDAADHAVVVRAFCPIDNIPEDPVTGSANALVAAALHSRGQLPGTGGRYIASQGREVGRDGRVEVDVDDAGDVWIGGYVQSVIRGHLSW